MNQMPSLLAPAGGMRALQTALRFGAAIQNRKKLVQRFLPAKIFLRRFTVNAHALGKRYVLVELPSVPMPPLLMGKVFLLVVGAVKVLVNLNCDFNRQGLSVVIDNDLQLSFLRSDFLLGNLNGAAESGTGAALRANLSRSAPIGTKKRPDSIKLYERKKYDI